MVFTVGFVDLSLQDEAITHIIPVVALLAGYPSLLQRCKDAIRVVQNTDRAQAFGKSCTERLDACAV